MYWIRTTELDKIEDSHDYLIEYKGIYKSDELFYKFFNFHEQAMNNSYNKKFDDGFYGFC